jgi:hypothetical protein
VSRRSDMPWQYKLRNMMDAVIKPHEEMGSALQQH